MYGVAGIAVSCLIQLNDKPFGAWQNINFRRRCRSETVQIWGEAWGTSIYINNWIAGRLFAKKLASEARE